MHRAKRDATSLRSKTSKSSSTFFFFPLPYTRDGQIIHLPSFFDISSKIFSHASDTNKKRQLCVRKYVLDCADIRRGCSLRSNKNSTASAARKTVTEKRAASKWPSVICPSKKGRSSAVHRSRASG